MTNNWEKALLTIGERYDKSSSNIDWMIVGSVGSVLQGCEMNPGDLDIYVRHQEGVKQFAELLQDVSLPDKSEGTLDHEWHSSKEEPVFTQSFPNGFTWTKARWKIHQFEVEVVHISNSAGIPDSLTGDGMWEGGQYIWSHSKTVHLDGYSFQTVPLEIQLESNLRRNREDRVNAIIKTMLEKGYNQELIKIALSSQHLNYFNSQIQEM